MKIDDYAGPTADELQPKERLEKGLLYSEHLDAMYGPDRAAKGVVLEIFDVAITAAKLKVDGSGNKTKNAILVTFRAPPGFQPPRGVAFDGKSLPWKLGLNQTNKASLIALHRGDNVVTRWVGPIEIYVDPNVEDKRTGQRTRGIRIKNVRPNFKPTFDYEKNVEARIDKARKARGVDRGHVEPVAEGGQPELSAEEVAAIEQGERR